MFTLIRNHRSSFADAMNSTDPSRSVPATIHLLAYASPRTHALDSVRQAHSVIASLGRKAGNWVELDFSGVESVSAAFTDELFGFLEREVPDIWLVPTHYNESVRPLLNRHLSLLQLRRDQAWSRASTATEFGSCAALAGHSQSQR
ncbi:STAS-like domain-containing protein [Methylococcus mesophilus]|uniref:STAS-like domain-containing protein n=1 Tax=Methylococcus mesophilus TaxID=2993564 RepID=UPI00224AE09E|nr:STAS-like domain-containing protein [Methylococcus mesophilus]UZR28699.1 STAS-like domain-containing protein [Methylococcus mesophilus]